MAKLTLIKRSVPKCGGCEIMRAQLDGNNVPYETIDITEDPSAIETYNLSSVPMLIIEKDNGATVRLSGVQPVDHVMALMNE